MPKETEWNDQRALVHAIQNQTAHEVMDMVRDLDDVVAALGLQESSTKPVDKIRKLQAQIEEMSNPVQIREDMFDFLDRIAVAAIPGFMTMASTGEHQFKLDVSPETALAQDCYRLAVAVLNERARFRRTFVANRNKKAKTDGNT